MTPEEKIVKIVDTTTHTRGASVEQVDSQGALIVKAVDTTVSVTGSGPTDKKFYTNHIDDYTTTDITYFGKESSDGVWQIMKIDETSNFPVFTYASETNNPLLTNYTDAWSARVTATYNLYSLS